VDLLKGAAVFDPVQDGSQFAGIEPSVGRHDIGITHWKLDAISKSVIANRSNDLIVVGERKASRRVASAVTTSAFAIDNFRNVGLVGGFNRGAIRGSIQHGFNVVLAAVQNEQNTDYANRNELEFHELKIARDVQVTREV
jgi:hypothetical protein